MQKSIAKNISMYPEDWQIVDQEARKLGLTTSASVRYIIRQFHQISADAREIARLRTQNEETIPWEQAQKELSITN